MKISVVIPVYNGSKTIEATLQSVLRQTHQADEILVLNDGSTDESLSILSRYSHSITLLEQENKGVAAARNSLCERATGDLIAFVDQDDLWHPTYLETQFNAFQAHPTACAFFTWHINFAGYGACEWPSEQAAASKIEEIGPLDFLRRYNRSTGQFASMSYCCVPRAVLNRLGSEPFCLSGVDDSYFCTLLPLVGHVVYNPAALVAYRVTDSAQSVNRLKMFGLWVRVFELLSKRYEDAANRDLKRSFRLAFASKRRQYGKLLMAAKRSDEARGQFGRSVVDSAAPFSVSKSLFLFFSTFLPPGLQPKWPPVIRQWKEPA